MKIMITEEKKEKLEKCTEKILRYAGKLMTCIERLDDDEEEYGERDDDDDDDMSKHGERRGRRRSGRYM